MNYRESLNLVSNYAISFYTKQMDARLLYHNHSHTWEMVDTVNKIASKYELDERDQFIILTAAWFYDTGYFAAADPGGYEDKSAANAAEFLKSIAISEDDIAEIKKCITSTQVPQHPQTKNEEIFCDAVLYYLGTGAYAEKSKLLKKETEILSNKKIPGNEWREINISLLETHRYFTDYCQSRLNKTKIENLNQLRRKQEEKSAQELLKRTETANFLPGEPGSGTDGETAIVVNISQQQDDQEKPGKKVKIKPGNPPAGREGKKSNARGIDAIFRTSSTNHQRLSSMADNKAHIMISVNSIIISVVLGLIVRKLDSNHFILVPTILLLLVNVITIIFSVLATRPRIPKGLFTKEQVDKKDVDLTFFGNYYKMEFEDYESGMKQMMDDREFLRGSMIRNLYGQAKVLGRKFTLLRISYNVFMFGIVIAVLAYVFALIFNQ